MREGFFCIFQKEKHIMALKKTPNPTFKSIVEIPVPGEKPEKCEFTFMYKSRKECDKYIAEFDNASQIDSLAGIIIDWPLNDVFGVFSKAALEDLVNSYPGAGSAILRGFIGGLHQGRTGN